MMKLRRLLCALFLTALFCSYGYAVETAPNRPKLDLDGVWDFAIDAQNVGETEGWFNADKALPTEAPEGSDPETPGKIKVPGIWDAQGYGAPTAKIKHNAPGKAWYKKTVAIPNDWNGSDPIYLVITGFTRYAKVWVNGRAIGGDVIGHICNREWNISNCVKPGEDANIAIRIDSVQRWQIDPILGCAAINDYLELVWGGIWGHVYVESRPTTRLDSLYLRTKLTYAEDDPTRVEKAVCLVETGLLDEKKSKSVSGSLKLDVFSGNERVASTVKKFSNLDLSGEDAMVPVEVAVPNARLWTPDTPRLYNVRVSLTVDGGATDVLESRYGMREIKFVGPRIYLNGKPFFLRGYGDDHIYPIEFSMPTDTDMYRWRLKQIKAYGFNYCRHHSVVMPHEYYDACDEIGMLPHAEMLIAYPPQIPGVGGIWKSHSAEGADPEPANEALRECWARIVKEYRNHPSIFGWVGGNELCMIGWELWDSLPLNKQMRDIAKKYDPDRYFTDCDGDFLNEYRNRGGREVEEFYSILFDEWTNPVLNHKKFDTGVVFDKPTISHESGNFLTFLRPDQIELFKDSNYKPFWMVDGAKKLEELGLAGEVEDWARASEQLYLLSHKYNVEGVRLNENLSGYQWWLIQDYWTTSNGIFDLFFRQKSLKPSDILPFNSALVLLQKKFEFAYRTGDTIEFEPYVSNFAGKDVEGTLEYKVTDERGKVLYQKKYENAKAESGKVAAFEANSFEAPEVSKPMLLTLSATFSCGGVSVHENTWTATLFPNKIAPKNARVVYADELAMKAFPKDWDVKPISELQGEYPTNAIYAVSWLTPEVVDAVKKGAGLLDFNGSQFLKAIGVRFQQTWWKAGDSETANNTGTFVYPNPIVDDVVDKSFCGASWAELLDGSRKYDLSGDRPRPSVIVRALSSLVLVRDEALYFEVGLGAGKAIVSGLNHAAAPDSPINAWILSRSLEELSSKAAASVQWDPETIIPPTVAPEGTTLGLERIQKNAEAMAWKSFRSDSADTLGWFCRQTQKGNDLLWNTASIDESDADTATFIFAGGCGFAAEPKSDGFVMSFNGEDLFKFDVPDAFDGTTEYVWKSEDGAATLKFDVKLAVAPNDSLGVFYVTVPKDKVNFGKAQEIGVRSLGEGSRRWFGINLITNFTNL